MRPLIALLEDSRETVQKQVLCRSFVRESITKNQVSNVKRNQKQLENVNSSDGLLCVFSKMQKSYLGLKRNEKYDA